MNKYMYQVVDSGDFRAGGFTNRADAREYKRACEKHPFGTEKPPFKIVRYELTNPTIIR